MGLTLKMEHCSALSWCFSRGTLGKSELPFRPRKNIMMPHTLLVFSAIWWMMMSSHVKLKYGILGQARNLKIGCWVNLVPLPIHISIYETPQLTRNYPIGNKYEDRWSVRAIWCTWRQPPKIITVEQDLNVGSKPKFLLQFINFFKFMITVASGVVVYDEVCSWIQYEYADAIEGTA